MEVKFKAFMAHIPKDHWSNTHKHLVKWLPPDRKYLLAGESTPYEHLHYLVEMTDTEYRNYANLTFKQKHKLRGRATEGKSRQYGKLKEIRDIERLQAYMIKDSLEYNVNIFTNIDKDKLKLLKDTISHKKPDKYPHKRYINYLKNELKHDGIYISIKQLLKIWLQVARTRLPTLKTLMYYAYQSEIITQDTYIQYHLVNLADMHEIPISCDWRLRRG